MKKPLKIAIVLTFLIANFVSGLGEVLIPHSSFLGTRFKERVGYVLSGAGDINADGFDDFLIGTFHHSTGGYDAGAAFLVLGSDTLNWGMGYSLENSDARFLGKNLEAAGFSVSGRGDVNGDGLSDILIGAPAGNDRVKTWSGKMYVVLGRESADWGQDFYLHENADLICEGENGQDLAGRAVSIIGDLNLDGCDEMLCAAPYNDAGAEDAGKVYLIPGRRDGWPGVYKLRNATASFNLTKKKANCGYSVAGIGDVNNDGTADFAIGAPGVNKVYVMFGRLNMNWGSDFNLKNADLTIHAENVLKDEKVGWKIQGLGDVNGDRISDFIISAIDYDKNPYLYGRGKVYLIFGRADGFDTSEISLRDANASFIGENFQDQAGWDIGGMGDINGDGFNDILIGAWYNDYLYEDAGKAYLIHGAVNGWEKDVSLSAVPDIFSGEDSINYAGYAVSIFGDINGDYRDDYVISAPYNDALDTWSGQVYLFASSRKKYILSGSVEYMGSLEAIPNTRVSIESESVAVDTSDGSGNFSFSVYEESDCSLIAEKTFGEDLNEDCITAHDAALIAMQAVGLDTLKHNYLSTADVNDDGRISVYDAVLTLKYALGFPLGSAMKAGEWLFFPDTIIVENIQQDKGSQNFSAVVRGDLNSSWHRQKSLSKQQAEVTVLNEWIEERAEDIVLPIIFKEKKGVVSFDIQIGYDAKKWIFTEVVNSNFLEELNVYHFDDTNGKLRIGAFSTFPVDVQQSRMRIAFKPSGITSRRSDLFTLDKFLMNDTEVKHTELFLNDVEKPLFELFQNYPNPFNGTTTISYNLNAPGIMNLSIMNVLGQEILAVDKMIERAGNFKFTWDAKDLNGGAVAAGIYLCQIKFKNNHERIKLLYVK